LVANSKRQVFLVDRESGFRTQVSRELKEARERFLDDPVQGNLRRLGQLLQLGREVDDDRNLLLPRKTLQVGAQGGQQAFRVQRGRMQEIGDGPDFARQKLGQGDAVVGQLGGGSVGALPHLIELRQQRHEAGAGAVAERSEERRVGKECRSRWARYQ